MKSPIQMSLRAVTVLAVAFTILFGAFVIGSVQAAAPQQSSPNEFPAFTMRVTVWQAAAPDGRPERIAVSEIQYRSRSDWSAVVVSDSRVPEAVGSWRSFKGNLSQSFNAQFKSSNSFTVDDAQAVIPDEFLSPFKIAALPSKGWRTTSDSASTRSLEYVSRAVGDLPRDVRTVLTHDKSSGLPLTIDTFHNGQLYERKTFARVG